MNATSSDKPGGNPQAQLQLMGALLTLALAGWLLYRHFVPPGIKVNTKPFASLGEFAADEFAKIQPAGLVQLVYDVPDKSADQNPAFGKSIEMQGVQALAFKARLAQLGKYTFEPDMKLPRPAMAMYSAWPGGAFKTLIQAPNPALVLFSSLPAIDDAGRALLRQRTGKLMVVGMAMPEVNPAVQANQVQLAIAYRVPVPPSTATTESPAEWVKRVFAVLTPASVAP